MKEKRPLVTVIMPVYNSEKYLLKCLDSILGQTYKDIEIVVVNNASTGNVSEIVKEYQNKFPNRCIKELVHCENQGTFRARVSGLTLATGTYISFIDSDDTMSVDFYRQLVEHAEKTNSEIVIADYVNEKDSGEKLYPNWDLVQASDFVLDGAQCMDTYMEYEGGCFSWHALWNKIFSRELIDRCLDEIYTVEDKFVLSDDILLTMIFFSNAKKVSNIHHVYYCHYLYDGASSVQMGASEEKILRSIKDQYTAFKLGYEYLCNSGLYEKYAVQFERIKKLLIGVCNSNIENARMPFHKKERLKAYIKETIDKTYEYELPHTEDLFFGLVQSAYNDTYEIFLQNILSSETDVVSFDVFDTLIVRDVEKPRDIFEILNPIYEKLICGKSSLLFSDMRLLAEESVRKKQLCLEGYEDITLKEIYEELTEQFEVPCTTAEYMKEKEFEYELAMCKARKSVKVLYELAVFLNKKVVAISDTYFSSEMISKLLDNCDYHYFDCIFVSSEYRLTKNSGKLYSAVLDKLNLRKKPNRIFHIGDNYTSDTINAKQHGIKAIHFPSEQDIFRNENPVIYSGNIYQKFSCLNAKRNLAERCISALAAHKMFDFPFVSFHAETDFNSNPYYMGYYPIGCLMIAFCEWIKEKLCVHSGNKVCFIGKKTSFIQKCFQIYGGNEFSSYELNYTERDFILSQIKDEKDLLNLPIYLNIYEESPSSIVQLFNDCIKDASDDETKRALQSHEMFTSVNEWITFARKHLTSLVNFYECSSKARALTLPDELRSDPTVCYICFAYNRHYSDCLKENVGYEPYILSFMSTSRVNYHEHENDCFLEQRLDNEQAFITSRLCMDNFLVPTKCGSQYKIVLKHFHNGAYDMIADWKLLCSKLPTELRMFSKNSLVSNYLRFLNYAAPYDRLIMMTDHYSLENDELVTSSKWFEHCDSDSFSVNLIPVRNYEYNNYPKWKKAIILALVDRKTLKEKIKNRYSRHPYFLKFLSVLYGIHRWIYRSLRK